MIFSLVEIGAVLHRQEQWLSGFIAIRNPDIIAVDLFINLLFSRGRSMATTINMNKQQCNPLVF
ncbi:hypothetical protein EGY12_03120 [Serratia sp. FDAARGOS_506]|nr:hypothetical protein EGY12_03120 [Serratia sp. FDAARGOS_506]